MKTAEFGSLFAFIRNGMNVKQDKSGCGLPITRIETISAGTVDPSRVGFADLSEKDCSDWLLKPGDILFSHINSVEHIGKCAMYGGHPEKLVHGMNLLCLRCDPDILVPQYARALIRSADFRGRLSSFVNKAVNQASVSIGNLKSIKVEIPPLDMQRRIAAILDKVEELRGMRRSAIARLDSFAQSIFFEMFGDPVRNEKNWQRVPLGGLLGAIESGWSPVCLDRPATENEWGVLKLGAVTWCIYDDTEQKALPTGVEPRPDLEVKPGDLLFTRKNTYELVAATAYVRATRPNLMLSDLIFRLRLLRDAPVEPEFLQQLLINPSKRRQIQTLASGSAGSMPNISKERLSTATIELPPTEFQRDFARRQSAIERLRSTSERSLGILDSLFDSLEHRAFRGEL